MRKGEASDKATFSISAIIPVHNGEKYLAEAIDSVLHQTRALNELIVVDDGSTDRTSEIAQSYDVVHYSYIEKGGVARARNKGISLAKGNLIAFLDGDDYWHKDKTLVQEQYLVDNPDVDIYQGDFENFFEPGIERPWWLPERETENIEQSFHLTCCLIKRECFERVGLFDESMVTGEDTDWYFRAIDSNLTIDKQTQVVMKRRIHHSNISHKRSYEPLARALKAKIDRRKHKEK